jgi:transposase
MIQLRAAIPLWLEDLENGLTQRFRRMLRGLWLDLLNLELRVKELDQEIEIAASTDPVATRLQQLRGVGRSSPPRSLPMSATPGSSAVAGRWRHRWG